MRADTKTQLQQRLRRFLPDEAVLAAAEDLAPYECDGLPLFRQKPAIAVLPATQAQLLEVLRVCADMEVPVVRRRHPRS
jgi:glycolate oxidase